MGQEIERKFLLSNDAWRVNALGIQYRQGYLNSAKERTVRIRTVGDQAFLTIKGISVGATRAEYEYPMPLDDCNALLDNLAEKPLIEKKRYKIKRGDLVWEIDEFFGDNRGLIVAEVELQSEDQPYDKPDWIGQEVTGDPRYFNSNLIKLPFNRWQAAAKIAARAEFRVFGQGVIDTVQQHMWAAGAVLQPVRNLPVETYFISRNGDDANVKVRGGLLDVKLKIGDTTEGYEIFAPAGKYPFPLSRVDVAAVMKQLKVQTPLPHDSYTVDALTTLAHTHPDLAVVQVEKTRYGFSVEGVICEYAHVTFNGAGTETACCESEDHAALRKVIKALGIAALPNTSYLKAAKRIVGMI